MNDSVRSMFSLERVCGVLGGERVSCIQGGWVVYMYMQYVVYTKW